MRNTEADRPALRGWIRAINETWSRTPASVLELGRLMSQARRALAYGQWSGLWRPKRLPFCKRKGEMLVVIGEGLGELDAQNSARLPAAWNTLYYLARLGGHPVESLIDQGRVHPLLTLQQARSLLGEFQPQTPQKPSRRGLASRLKRFAEFVRVNLAGWSSQERRFIREGFLAVPVRIPAEANGASRVSAETLSRAGGPGILTGRSTS